MLLILFFIPLIFVKRSVSLTDERLEEIFRNRECPVVQQSNQKSADPPIIGLNRRNPTTSKFTGEYLEKSVKVTVSSLECGKTYFLRNLGYIYFKLDSGGKPCYHEFIGSKSENATVGILCGGYKDEHLTLGKEGRLTITDGTEGSLTPCRNFSFKDTPRIARNGEPDLYVTYKGSSTDYCFVIWLERIKPILFAEVSAKPLKASKKFKGFKTDQSCTCGKRRDYGKIVGGTTAEKFEFPWLGAVVHKFPGYVRRPSCGGALINNLYFVSAAHCFWPEPGITIDDMEVLLHAHVMDRSRTVQNPNDPKYQNIPGWNLPPETDESENSIRIGVAEIHSHGASSLTGLDFDIAILKLKTPVDFADGRVSPICLPEIKDQLQYKDGDGLVAAGWGRPYENAPSWSRILQKLDLPYVSKESCRGYSHPTFRHFCAGFKEGGKDACQGDSGGPIIRQINRETNQYVLSGVVSGGVGCARPNKLGFYTSVPELIQWVYHHGSNGATWCKKS